MVVVVGEIYGAGRRVIRNGGRASGTWGRKSWSDRRMKGGWYCILSSIGEKKQGER